ncbi:hypothetical protein MES5069_620006 [Mesorhizobium escarrei]|uniref:Transposase n=1 Tax=Mesorhizobium escarrei TaxID=666018 RepID=A0ABM9EEE5_9HYPH|nr:hypothetical protein MES5069_620006 [Mesorhizobium escarrei]
MKDATRPPRRRPLSAETVKNVVDMTLNTKPAGAMHWSVRTMAKASGISRRRCSGSGRRTASSRV